METRVEPIAASKMIRRILSGNFLDLHLVSSEYELVHITVTNLIGETKVSSWEEVFSGDNFLAIDISRLLKGSYKLSVHFATKSNREEIFSLA
ncbi:MAG: hypothetical protein MUF42_00845 [Cytophagaceae bacterium]|jgi:hypothetical protein|nr:hypothetical protein [Cytophagaceae bacterium]